MADFQPLHNIGEILGQITRETRDRLIAFNLPHFMSQGFGITKTMRIFREFGYRFANQHFRDIWHEVQIQETLQRQVLYHNRDTLLTDLILPKAKYPMDEKYLWVGRLSVFDPQSKTISEKYMAIETSQELLHYQAEEFVRQGYLTDSDPRANIIDVQLVRGYINGDYE